VLENVLDTADIVRDGDLSPTTQQQATIHAVLSLCNLLVSHWHFWLR
jgi:hypothetical protein